MRRTPIVAIGLVAALSLAACSSGDGSSKTADPASPNPSDSANTRVVQVDGKPVTIQGEPGAAPILRFDKPLAITETKVYPVSKGTSKTKLSDGQLLGVNYVLTSAEDGSDKYSTWASNQPEAMILSPKSMSQDVFSAFSGGSVYAELLQAVPASDNQPTPLLAYLEVDSAQSISNRAEGTTKTPPATMPQVTLDKDGKPSVTMPKGDAPTKLTSFTTIESGGDYVDSGDAIAVNYSGWLWDGKQFDSSWDRGVPFTLTLGAGQVIPGWDEGIAKQKVGSQVLLVIPPDKGYGDKANGDIPANSTLVFVVDILGKVAK